METWLDIKGFEGLYQISSEGQVRNPRTGKTLKPRFDSDGYHLITLWKGKPTKKYDVKVHRVVILHFVGEPPSVKHVVDHINRQRSFNHVANLRWATVSDNNRNCVRKNTSGVKGVRQKRPGQWQAYTSVDGKFKSIGGFRSKVEACVAYDNFKKDF